MKKTWITGAIALFIAMNLQAQDNLPIESGSFTPSWDGTANWECPDWFRDAKFGIWAHWGPQNQPESGDWYARNFYYGSGGRYTYRKYNADRTYSDIDCYGFKDVINQWKTEGYDETGTWQEWKPQELIDLYYKAGARYFCTLGQHHDNFDLWNSPYQPWNSVNMGPKRDIVKEWQEACKAYNLPFAVSMHGAHAWSWYEIAQDYDGNLTAEDGKGQWWEGYDPQDLYAQQHTPSANYRDQGAIHGQWGWTNGASIPSEPYKTKFQNRVLQCIKDYHPDMLYFDDTVLPFYGTDESVGLNILADFYNRSEKQNQGQQQVVVCGKILNSKHKKSMLWDVERGIPNGIQETPWQTCTCIGGWHYNRYDYEHGNYKSAEQVINMLVDIVSKNGNLLLSVPLRRWGVLDEKVAATVAGITEWMEQNSTSIYGTRPWKTFGEGPLADTDNPLNAQGFNEGNNYSSLDVRYAQRNDTLFATIMRWPSAGDFTFESCGYASPYYNGKVKSVKLLGSGNVNYRQELDGLIVEIPATRCNKISPVFVITFDETDAEALLLKDIVKLYEEKVTALTGTTSFLNTGKLSTKGLDVFVAVLNTAKTQVEADEATQQKALRSLRNAYKTLQETGVNQGGVPNVGGEDITVEQLIQVGNFDRTSTTNNGLRFGTPKNWSVENFTIPQTNGKGTKNGIDNDPGYNCLMLGVWQGEDGTTQSDLSNARIYRTLHLMPGLYYFGATYNANYNLGDAYIFASGEKLDTKDIPSKSIAFWPIKKAGISTTFNGIFFQVEEEQDVIVGFQANLTGATQQEFRVIQVKLLYYGDLKEDALSELVSSAENLLAGIKVNSNTGFFKAEAVQQLESTMADAQAIVEDASAEEISAAYFALQDAIDNFLKNGRNLGGQPRDGGDDYTLEILGEASNFSTTKMGSRYGTPKLWSVENYNITDGQGSRNGIDHYPGYNCLSLGVWNDAGNNTAGNLSNARIYKKVHLEAGRWYFGAKYETTYNITDRGYLYVAEANLSTDDIPQKSIAFYAINNNKNTNDGLFYGLYFNLEEGMDVILGFQADMNDGSSTKEFRAKEVCLRYYGEITFEKVIEYKSSIMDLLDHIQINDNTGFYRQTAVDSLLDVVDGLDVLKSTDDDETIEKAYNLLEEAYNHFLFYGKNPGGFAEEIGAQDITAEQLMEPTDFARTAETLNQSRYATPKNWIVENYNLTNAAQGNRNGIDGYPGYDCLSLGIWGDKGSNTDGTLENARIYQQISLPAGHYFFGASYEALYQLNEAYIFASEGVLSTKEIPTLSMAYEPISNTTLNAKLYGIYFTLPQDQKLILGFQADMSKGANEQEFRVKELRLYSYDKPDVIQEIYLDKHIDMEQVPLFYNLMGQRLNAVPRQGFVIVKQGSTIRKYFLK